MGPEAIVLLSLEDQVLKDTDLLGDLGLPQDAHLIVAKVPEGTATAEKAASSKRDWLKTVGSGMQVLSNVANVLIKPILQPISAFWGNECNASACRLSNSVCSSASSISPIKVIHHVSGIGADPMPGLP